jgi:hypothetical protein
MAKPHTGEMTVRDLLEALLDMKLTARVRVGISGLAALRDRIALVDHGDTVVIEAWNGAFEAGVVVQSAEPDKGTCPVCAQPRLVGEETTRRWRCENCDNVFTHDGKQYRWWDKQA